MQPEPTVDIQINPMTDDCAGSIGLRIQAVFSGEPPFRLSYNVKSRAGDTDSHAKPSSTNYVKTFNNAREEIVFQPDQVGEFVWQATKLEDAVYHGEKAIPLTELGLSQTTTVYPLASARWKKDAQTDIRSCEGDIVNAELELKVYLEQSLLLY